MKQTISVLIPSYNRCSYLPRALDSVIKQSCKPSEIIVIDDGSNDDTAKMIDHRYRGVNYIYQTRQGVSAARNLGIKKAKGDWIALLDSDDVWHSDKLKVQSEIISANPGYLLLHANEVWIRNGLEIHQQKKHKKRGGFIFEYCLPLCVISPSSALIHRSLFDKIGMFDETLPACEDYDLWLRVCSKYPVLYSDRKLIVKHGGHPDQLSKRYWGMDRFRIRSMAKLLLNNDLPVRLQKLTVEMMQKKLEILLTGAKKHNNPDVINEFTMLSRQFNSFHYS